MEFSPACPGNSKQSTISYQVGIITHTPDENTLVSVNWEKRVGFGNHEEEKKVYEEFCKFVNRMNVCFVEV